MAIVSQPHHLPGRHPGHHHLLAQFQFTFTSVSRFSVKSTSSSAQFSFSQAHLSSVVTSTVVTSSAEARAERFPSPAAFPQSLAVCLGLHEESAHASDAQTLACAAPLPAKIEISGSHARRSFLTENSTCTTPAQVGRPLSFRGQPVAGGGRGLPEKLRCTGWSTLVGDGRGQRSFF